MADTIISDAVVGIQDEGIASISDGNEDWGSAGLRMMLSQAVDSDSYVRSDSELTFTNHDGTNDQVDVTGGVAYLDLTGETVNVQSGLGGSSPPAYDTALPTLPAIPVIAPSTTADLDVQDATLSSVWIAYATDSNVSGVSAGDIYLRSDDTGSVSAPPHPNAEIGQANPDDASADTLLNRFGSPTFADLDVSTATTGSIVDKSSGNSYDVDNLANGPLVKAKRINDSNTFSATTWGPIAFNEVEDTAGIQDSSFNINPNKTGRYLVAAHAVFQSGVSGDTLIVAIRNVDNGTKVGGEAEQIASASRCGVSYVEEVELQANTNYKVQGRNANSSFEFDGDAPRSFYTLRGVEQ